MDAAVDFYRRLGVELSVGGHWPPGTNCRHAGGENMDLDNEPMAHLWGDEQLAPGDVVIGFSLPTRDAVDDLYRDLTGAGYKGRREPYDAFWGARYAMVDDPDGHAVGLMSPIDDTRKYVP